MLSPLISSAGGRALWCNGSLSSIGGTATQAEKMCTGPFEIVSLRGAKRLVRARLPRRIRHGEALGV